MHDLQSLDLAGVPVKWIVLGHLAMNAFKWLGEFISSVRAGGGLKRIIVSFYCGEQMANVVSDDYKKAMSKPPFPKKDV